MSNGPSSGAYFNKGKIIEIFLQNGLLALALAILGFYLTSKLDSNKAHQAEKLETIKLELNKSLEAFKLEQTKSLETFKDQLAKQRTITDKKYERIQAISAACAVMNSIYFTHSSKDKGTKDADDRYDKAIELVMNAHNDTAHLFTDNYSRELARYLWIHYGMQRKGLQNCEAYRPFADGLYKRFGLLCQLELGIIDKMPSTGFELLPWDSNRIISEKYEKYLNENFDEWNHWRRQMEKKTK